MDLFDDFIFSEMSNSINVTHQTIAAEADIVMDDYNQVDWDNSSITSETFFAITFDNRMYKRGESRVTDSKNFQLLVPSDRSFNEFQAITGVTDRIIIGTETYEVIDYDDDNLFEQMGIVITLNKLDG